MLRIEHLSKTFDAIKAVDDITLEVQKGEIFGLLGPNGAGKTTAISMIAGLLKPDSGKIAIDSMDIENNLRSIKKIMGVVPQDMAFYEELSGRENLLFWGKLQGVRGKILDARIDAYLKATGLLGRERDLVKKYSGGMKRRINLIIGLIHQPKLLLLDEPTIGIDIQTRLNIYNLIKEASNQETTILYTTHNLQEAEELCHRIAIMDHGDIIARGTPEQLLTEHFNSMVLQIPASDVHMDEIPIPIKFAQQSNVIEIESQDINKTLQLLLEHDVNLANLKIRSHTLDDLFLKLTGHELRA